MERHSKSEFMSLSAKGKSQVGRLGTARVLDVARSAVAAGIVGAAVEGRAVLVGAEDVVLVTEGVAPLRVQLVCRIELAWQGAQDSK